jgi:anti-anti-sigma factor
VVGFVGELDALTGPYLERYLAGDPGPKRLDLRAVTFLDTSGLDSLERAQRLCRENGWSFTIEHFSPPVERLMQLAGLGEVAVIPRAALDDAAPNVDQSPGGAPPSRPNLRLVRRRRADPEAPASCASTRGPGGAPMILRHPTG